MPKNKRKREKKESDDSQEEELGGPNSFASLRPPLSSGVLSYIQKQNFTRMTPVQAATIPLFLASKDVAVQAVTGSGKTLSFLIPVVECLLKVSLKMNRAGALILSPTRELAQQTHSVATALCKHCGMKEPLLLVGGSSSSSSSASSRPVTADLENFRKVGHDILIGTPGRVEDILSRYSVIDTQDLEYVVLDEADVLLSMGFAVTLQSILSHLPKMRRTGLFSATASATANSSLKEWMTRAGLRNPVWIDVAVTSESKDESSLAHGKQQAQATPSSLSNYYLVCPLDEKLSRLSAFLEDHRSEKIIVFFLTCACVDFYGNILKELLPKNCIEPLHGKMVQKRREKTMERFRSGEDGQGGALLCTDVAARGLDVSGVHWVVQFDAPQDPAFYVHRVGRSARAGKSGSSLLFLTRKEEAYVDLLRMRKIPLSTLPESERCAPQLESEDKKPDSKKTQEEDGDRTIVSAAGNDKIIPDILPAVKKLTLSDRDFLEKGTKAFTSYIRAYKEHHCAFVLRFASLDLGLLATSFCLLRLPKMPELRDILQRHRGRLPRFTPAGNDVDIFAIPFKDKAREVARQKRLKQVIESGGKNAKLIEAERRKAEKERKAKERRQQAVEKGRNPDKKRGKNARIMDEWDELAKEERLYKKLRKGKITKQELEEQLADEGI